uniref:Putative transcriptional regulatory protein Minf_0651 n=1 Tax=Schistocephalus solidus TaxID=70667 RepID=A0A183TGI0_SCHSO
LVSSLRVRLQSVLRGMNLGLQFSSRFIQQTLSSSRSLIWIRHIPVLSTQLRNAGHSHWQNVRHTKEAKDKERARMTSIILSQLNIAIKAGGGSKDPKLNSRVAAVLANAKANNIPMETLNRRLAAVDITDPYVIEIQAPGGIFALVETRAKNVRPIRDKIQGIAKKYGFRVSKAAGGAIAKEFFDHVGLVLVNQQDGLDNLDKATELAIEAGAADVRETTLEDGKKYFECEPTQVDAVRMNLESHNITVYDSDAPYVPRETIEVSPESYTLILEMYDRLKENVDYVENVYDNLTEPSFSISSSA